MRFRPVTAVLTVLLPLSFITICRAFQPNDESVQTIPTHQPERPKVPGAKTYMHLKELAAQRIFRGLIREDFQEIKKGAESLKWIVFDSPKPAVRSRTQDEIYSHFRLELTRLSVKIEEMAKEENLAGAAYRYQSLTATCIACHEHIRQKASLDAPK